MNWHLDTNVLIECLRGNVALSARIRKEHPNVAMSALVLGELLFGIRLSRHPRDNEENLARFIRPIRLIPFDERCARAYGEIRASLRAQGRPCGEADMAIAAMAHNAVIVTRNRRHFESIPGLNMADWNT